MSGSGGCSIIQGNLHSGVRRDESRRDAKCTQMPERSERARCQSRMSQSETRSRSRRTGTPTWTCDRFPNSSRPIPPARVNIPLLHHDAATGQMTPNPEFLEVMQANFPPDAKLLIGCQVGARSAQAAQILASAGFTDVTNVVGRLRRRARPDDRVVRAEGWVQAGLPVEPAAAPGATIRRSARAGGKGNAIDGDRALFSQLGAAARVGRDRSLVRPFEWGARLARTARRPRRRERGIRSSAGPTRP